MRKKRTNPFTELYTFYMILDDII